MRELQGQVRRRWRRNAAMVLGILAALVVAGPAWADKGADAAKLARDAEGLISAGKYQEGCAKLEESLHLDPRGATQLDLAVCYEKAGRIASAYRAYGTAADLAKLEKRRDREKSALSARRKLKLRLPYLRFAVPAASRVKGLKVTLNGLAFDAKIWNTNHAVDPGTVILVATAPGRKRWEKKFTMRKGIPRQVTLLPLAKGKDTGPPPGPSPKPVPASKPAPGADPAPSPVPGAPAPTPPTEPTDLPEPAEPSTPSKGHQAGRLVVEVGVMGGLMIDSIDTTNVDELNGKTYSFRSPGGGEVLATCGNLTAVAEAGECEATFKTAVGGLIGGNLFVGWAFADRFHLGLRALGGAQFPGSYYVVGGPSLSARVAGPLWLGAGFMVGAGEHIAELQSARGSVPATFQDINGGDRVEIPPGNLGFTDGTIESGFMFGGQLEVALSLLGPSPDALISTSGDTDSFFSGAMFISALPVLTKAPDGIVVAIPLGISYRYH